MDAGEMREGLRHARTNLYRMLRNCVRETVNSLVQSGRERLDSELFESQHQGMREAVQSVAEATDAVALDVVQDLTHLLGGELLMIQEGDEICDRSLEINVVLPQSIVGVDKKGLWRE